MSNEVNKKEFRAVWFSPTTHVKTWQNVEHLIRQAIEHGASHLTVQFDTPDTAELRVKLLAAQADCAAMKEQLAKHDEAIDLLRSELKNFKLSHEHAPNLPHTRTLGGTYGWCGGCEECAERSKK